MSKLGDARALKIAFDARRAEYGIDFLENLADLSDDHLAEYCYQEFPNDPDQAADLIWHTNVTKAHRSPADFAELASEGHWKRAPHLDVLNDIFVDACYNRRFVIVSTSIRHGKSLSLEMKVPTPDKHWVRAGDVRPGDMIFGEHGKPIKVLEVTEPQEAEYYKITFSDNTTIEACEDHNWTVMSEPLLEPDKNWWHDQQTLTTKDLVESRQDWFIPNAEPLELAEKQLNYDPYNMGLNQDYIPEDYLWGSLLQRSELLRGFVDSENGSVEIFADSVWHTFESQSDHLLDSVFQVACSLGYCPERESRLVTWGVQNYCRAIVSIEPIGKREGVCYVVDNPSHLYLAGEQMVPTHNSEFLSKWAVAWYLSKFPDRKVMQVTYGTRLSQDFGRKARGILEETAGDFFGHTLGQSATDKFSLLDHQGSYYASAVEASVIGMGGHMIIVDDPYRDMAQAYNPTQDKKLKKWWKEVLRGRLEPGGSFIIIMARWKQGDLVDWLVDESKAAFKEREEEERQKELERVAKDMPALPVQEINPESAGQDARWINIEMPAVWDSDEEDLILGRKKGDLLWPGRFTKQEMDELRRSVGALTWAAQLQQKPLSVEDTSFPMANWVQVLKNDLPRMAHTVRYWDLSAGGERSDYVCGVKMSIDNSGRYYIHDVARSRFTGNDADIEIQNYVRDVSRADFQVNRDCKFFFEETAGAGKAISKNYQREVFVGLPAEPHKKQGSKEANAMPLASHQQDHNVHIVSPRRAKGSEHNDQYDLPEWAEVFFDELIMFPNVKNDDQVDAASGAQQKLEDLYYDKDEDGAFTVKITPPKGGSSTQLETRALDVSKILSQGASSQLETKTKSQKRMAKLYIPGQRQRRTSQSGHWSQRP